VLSRARAALAAGRYDTPPGRNALDLYSAVLLTRPDDAEAREGLETTIARLIDKAQQAATAGDAAEARRIAQRVLQVDAGNGRARGVIASLTFKPRPVPAVVAPAPPRVEPVVVAPASPMYDATQAAADDAERLASVPVTRLTPVPAATPPPPPTPITTTRVQADPLAPRVVGPGALPTAPTRRPPPGGLRHYAGPVVAALPIAGYEKRSPDATGSGTTTPPPVASEAGVQHRDLEPVATPEPVYPPAAFRQGIEGWVEVEYTVGERGTTGDVTVIAAEPRGVFDDAAIAAVASWRYRPRIVNGQPVAQRTSVTLQFNVEN
jgi:protein TonB